MAKSIHERVRATLEKQAREAKRAEANSAENRERARRFRALEKGDLDHERGVVAFERGEDLPANASKAMRDGYRSAERSEYFLDVTD